LLFEQQWNVGDGLNGTRDMEVSVIFAAHHGARVDGGPRFLGEQVTDQEAVIRDGLLYIRGITGNGEDAPMRAVVGRNNSVDGAGRVSNELRDG
jgi:hypothetical protein